jgi:hypothetical protein
MLKAADEGDAAERPHFSKRTREMGHPQILIAPEASHAPQSPPFRKEREGMGHPPASIYCGFYLIVQCEFGWSSGVVNRDSSQASQEVAVDFWRNGDS